MDRIDELKEQIAKQDKCYICGAPKKNDWFCNDCIKSVGITKADVDQMIFFNYIQKLAKTVSAPTIAPQ